MKKAKTWLATQSVANWEADRKQGFTLYGMNERYHRTAATMKAGELIVHYAIGGFITGVRQVIADGIVPLGRASHYDDNYPWAIRTMPLAVLPRYAWVPVKPLLPVLAMVKKVETGMYCFQASLKSIPRADGPVFLDAVLAQAGRLRQAPFTAATEVPRTWAYRQAIRASGDGDALRTYLRGKIDAPTFWRAVQAGGGAVPFLDWPGTVDLSVWDQMLSHAPAAVRPAMVNEGEGADV